MSFAIVYSLLARDYERNSVAILEAILSAPYGKDKVKKEKKAS